MEVVHQPNPLDDIELRDKVWSLWSIERLDTVEIHKRLGVAEPLVDRVLSRALDHRYVMAHVEKGQHPG